MNRISLLDWRDRKWNRESLRKCLKVFFPQWIYSYMAFCCFVSFISFKAIQWRISIALKYRDGDRRKLKIFWVHFGGSVCMCVCVGSFFIEMKWKKKNPNEIIVKDINISDSGEMSNNTLAQKIFKSLQHLTPINRIFIHTHNECEQCWILCKLNEWRINEEPKKNKNKIYRNQLNRVNFLLCFF